MTRTKTVPDTSAAKLDLPEKGIKDRIKAARLREGYDLTIEALSRLSKMIDPAGQGIAHQTIVRYEKGDVLPGARELRILADSLRVSTDYLIMGAERRGVIPLGDALNTLARMIGDQMSAENSYLYPSGNAADEYPVKLIEAKKPQPRK